MEREILFRAWDGREMLYQPIDGAFGLYRFLGFLRPAPILMQYTGLKDKSAKEIFEGDILKSFSKYVSCYEVFFADGSFRLRYKLQSGEYYHWGLLLRIFEIDRMYAEVIGNCCEHPHLLTPQSPAP